MGLTVWDGSGFNVPSHANQLRLKVYITWIYLIYLIEITMDYNGKKENISFFCILMVFISRMHLSKVTSECCTKQKYPSRQKGTELIHSHHLKADNQCNRLSGSLHITYCNKAIMKYIQMHRNCTQATYFITRGCIELSSI